MHVCMLSNVQLFLTPWTINPVGSSVHGICQARILAWVGPVFPALGDLPDPGIKSMSLASPALAGGFFSTVPLGKLK